MAALPSEAVRTTVVAVATRAAFNEALAVLLPAARVIDEGTGITFGAELVIATFTPPSGAAEDRVTVAVNADPPDTVAAESVKACSAGAAGGGGGGGGSLEAAQTALASITPYS